MLRSVVGAQAAFFSRLLEIALNDCAAEDKRPELHSWTEG
jgi:hypothetical protein